MLILLLLGVAAAYYLQRKIYQKKWYDGIRVSVGFQDAGVYAGDTTVLREEIMNDKTLPIPALEVRFSTSRNLEISGEAKRNAAVSDQNYQRDIFSMWGRQKVIRRIPIFCKKRGVYSITKCEVVGYDLFYHSSLPREQRQEGLLYVYPRQVDTKRIRLVCQMISGSILAQRKLQMDPFEFSGIREYRTSDPMNSINWKASARNQALMVNQHDSTTNIQVMVLLDVEDSGIYKYEELVEESIGIASSLAAMLVTAGMELNVISNGWAAGPWGCQETELHIRPGTGQMQELNRRLSEIDLKKDVIPIHKIMENMGNGKQADPILVLISKNEKDDTWIAAQKQADSGRQVIWVKPVHGSSALEDYEGKNGFAEASRQRSVHCILWEVG